MKKIKKIVRDQRHFFLGILLVIIILPVLLVVIRFTARNLVVLIASFSPQETWTVPPLQPAVWPKITNREVNEEEYFSIPTAHKDFDDLSFASSPDGRSFAYVLKNNDLETLAINGRAMASYAKISFIRFSDNGTRLAYGAKVRNKEMVVLDGREGKLYDWIFEPYFFTPDNKYFIYKARNDKGEMIVFNNWESQAYDKIYQVFLTPDKSQLVYFAKKNQVIWRTTVNLKDLEK